MGTAAGSDSPSSSRSITESKSISVDGSAIVIGVGWMERGGVSGTILDASASVPYALAVIREVEQRGGWGARSRLIAQRSNIRNPGELDLHAISFRDCSQIARQQRVT